MTAPHHVEPWLIFAPVLGITAAVMAYRVRKRAAESAAWPRVDGVITNSEAMHLRSGPVLAVSYRYYTPEERQGANPGPGGRLVSDPDAFVKRYPKGAKVRIRYDPSRPEISFIDSGEKGPVLALTVLAAIGISFPFVYFLWLRWIESQ